MSGGYDVSVSENGVTVMQWHGPAASRRHAEIHAKAAYAIVRRAAALGAGGQPPEDVACEASVSRRHTGAMAEHWTLTSWGGNGRASDLIKLPDRVACAIAVAVTAPDFNKHYERGREISACVDIIAVKAGTIRVDALLSAMADDGLHYLMRRREAMRCLLLALGVAHLAAGADVVSEEDLGNANIHNLFRDLNDQEKELLPGQGAIAPQGSATLRAAALKPLRAQAVTALASLRDFAKAVGEKTAARAVANRIKEIEA